MKTATLFSVLAVGALAYPFAEGCKKRAFNQSDSRSSSSSVTPWHALFPHALAQGATGINFWDTNPVMLQLINDKDGTLITTLYLDENNSQFVLIEGRCFFANLHFRFQTGITQMKKDEFFLSHFIGCNPKVPATVIYKNDFKIRLTLKEINSNKATISLDVKSLDPAHASASSYVDFSLKAPQ